MRIDWTPHAEVDLVAIHEYIATDSPVNAVRMVNRLIGSVRHLRTFARSARIVPELNDPLIREVIEPPYRVIFRIAGNCIEILTVLHSARLLRWPPY